MYALSDDDLAETINRHLYWAEEFKDQAELADRLKLMVNLYTLTLEEVFGELRKYAEDDNSLEKY